MQETPPTMSMCLKCAFHPDRQVRSKSFHPVLTRLPHKESERRKTLQNRQARMLMPHRRTVCLILKVCEGTKIIRRTCSANTDFQRARHCLQSPITEGQCACCLKRSSLPSSWEQLTISIRLPHGVQILTLATPARRPTQHQQPLHQDKHSDVSAGVDSLATLT